MLGHSTPARQPLDQHARVIQGILIALLNLWSLGHLPEARSESIVQIPLLGAVPNNNRGAVEILLLRWDHAATPDPLTVTWANKRIAFLSTSSQALDQAFQYALNRLPNTHTGTVWIHGAAYVPARTDGPSAGAVMTVGLLAALRGEAITPGIAMTGTVDRLGRVGPVGAIADKVRAAVREGYRTILIPRGQLDDPSWNLSSLALELNATVKEVGTIDEAYQLMTGRVL